MSEISDRVRANYDRMRRRRIEIPEWGTEEARPLVAFYDPMTIADRRRLGDKARNGDVGMYVDVLINKLKDADGKPIFTEEDRPVLQSQSDASVVIRVGLAIMAGRSNEDIEKN